MTAANRALVYYALGGGLGHLTRALAIISALVESTSSTPRPIRLITNSSHAEIVTATALSSIDSARRSLIKLISVRSPQMLQIKLAESFAEPPGLLIVDTFPRGLMGELAGLLKELACPRILIQRFLKQNYLDQFSIGDFVGAHYQQSLRLSDNLPRQQFPVPTIELPPVLFSHHSLDHAPELFPTDDRTRPRLLFIDFGAAADRYIAALPEIFSVRIITIDRARAALLPRAMVYFPAAALFDQADLIVGSCGYNLYHEVQSASASAIFLPQPKLYDDQFGRASQQRSAISPADFARVLMEWYRSEWPSLRSLRLLPPSASLKPRETPRGAAAAAAAILADFL